MALSSFLAENVQAELTEVGQGRRDVDGQGSCGHGSSTLAQLNARLSALTILVAQIEMGLGRVHEDVYGSVGGGASLARDEDAQEAAERSRAVIKDACLAGEARTLQARDVLAGAVLGWALTRIVGALFGPRPAVDVLLMTFVHGILVLTGRADRLVIGSTVCATTLVLIHGLIQASTPHQSKQST